MNKRTLSLILAAVLLPAMARSAESTSAAADPTDKLIAVLQSEASFFEKARACQQLGELGQRHAVPALAALLTSPELSAYARSGLEGIPDPSAAKALRDAAGRLKGLQLIGVVNSLGARRDGEAVERLRQIAADPNSGAVSAALMALGSIASAPAIQILKEVLLKGPDEIRAQGAAAGLLAAERQQTAGNQDEARALYDLIRQAPVPTAYRISATRGAILTRTTDQVPFLIQQLQSDTLAIRNAALLSIRDVPDDSLATALNAHLPHAQPELQKQLLLALIDCHNAQSIPVIEAVANGTHTDLRTTALRVLGQLTPDAVPGLLRALQKAQTVEDKAIIVSGLKTMPGAAVDDQLLQALGAAATAGARIDLIRILGARGAVKANNALLKHAAGPDPEIALAALTALQPLAGANEVAGLIALIRSDQDTPRKEAAENALIGACSRSGGSPSGAEAVLAELKPTAPPALRNCWIRVLAAVGYPKALPAIETAAHDPDESVADTALAQLGRWPDPSPMDLLLKMLDSGGTPRLRQRALASVIDLAATMADETKAPAPTIVRWIQRVHALTQTVDEKRRILAILGHLPTRESLPLLVPYLEDPGLRAEAAAAVIQIAPTLAGETDTDALQAALGKITAALAPGDLRDRAIRAAETVRNQPARVSLFDGRSLAGWAGDTNVWRVREGAIVGGSMAGNLRNEFLTTLRRYTNFVLRLEYKLVGQEGFVNGGVQFRSVRVPNPPNEMKGYQADIGAGYSGSLYDESRRNTFLARADEDTLKRREQPGDWNRYELRCDGPHIEIWLNGERTADYTETDATIPQEGFVGLQIHGGCKAEIAFRNIIIQERL